MKFIYFVSYYKQKNRLYGRKRDYESILKFLVASTIISTTSLGPRIYGLFKQGHLEEFIEVCFLEKKCLILWLIFLIFLKFLKVS